MRLACTIAASRPAPRAPSSLRSARRLERRALRHPGRRLARRTGRDARRAARPARRLGVESSASTSTGTGSSRRAASRTGGESDLVLDGLREQRDRAPSSGWSARRAGRTAGGRRTSPPGATAFASFARTAATRYRWVRAVARLERAEPGPLAAPDEPRRSTCASSSTRPMRRSTARTRGAKVAGGVTAPRGGTGGVSPVDWIRGMRGARLDAYAHHPYPSSDARDALHGRLRPLRDDHDGDARAAALRGRPRLRPEADLADRVRVPDRAPTGSRSSARRR